MFEIMSKVIVNFINSLTLKTLILQLNMKCIFVSASYQTGLDTRSMTVGVRRGEGQARAKARARLVIGPLRAMWA